MKESGQVLRLGLGMLPSASTGLRRHTWAAHAGVGCEHIGWLMTHINGQQVDHANRAALLTTVSVPGNTREVTLRKPICGTFEMDGLF